MSDSPDRRIVVQTCGVPFPAGAADLLSTKGQAAPGSGDQLVPHGATALADLTKRLSEAPRRRNFKTVPMILNDPDQWDHEALSEVIAYRGAQKQVWDNTGIASPWLNVMRNSLNAQV